ncbi:hypothetical protein [Schaedlerella arabinosiphila]|nr:hypothetical protein [Schaedlerella arabinosiphila]KAI4442335.1 hypothetical protein C824_004846 [Schaedlerella arabinosiphila]
MNDELSLFTNYEEETSEEYWSYLLHMAQSEIKQIRLMDAILEETLIAE